MLDDNVSRKVRPREIMALQTAANVRLKWSQDCQTGERFNNIDNRKYQQFILWLIIRKQNVHCDLEIISQTNETTHQDLGGKHFANTVSSSNTFNNITSISKHFAFLFRYNHHTTCKTKTYLNK